MYNFSVLTAHFCHWLDGVQTIFVEIHFEWYHLIGLG